MDPTPAVATVVELGRFLSQQFQQLGDSLEAGIARASHLDGDDQPVQAESSSDWITLTRRVSALESRLRRFEDQSFAMKAGSVPGEPGSNSAGQPPDVDSVGFSVDASGMPPESAEEICRQLMLGEEAHLVPAARDVWSGLLKRVLEDDPAAGVLAGQLIMFRHLPADRRPQVLSSIGESFYRCYPKSAESDLPLEQAVVDWLNRIGEQSGMSNTVETVRSGDRFDAACHMSTRQGGIEVDEVHGWVVRKGQDKVYMKALVTTR